MDSKFFCSLFEGDSPNGVKLGMGLTGGEFWGRVVGCQNLYRGEGVEDVNFAAIISVHDANAKMLPVGDSMLHETGMEYLYVLRRADKSGCEEESLDSCIRFGIDQAGELSNSVCNTAINLRVNQSGEGEVELSWYYCPLDQFDDCIGFNIYHDNGLGQINYSVSVNKIEYVGAKNYRLKVKVPSVSRYLFAVRSVSSNGTEGKGCKEVGLEMNTIVMESARSLNSKRI